ncbi:arabinose efflux permease [Longilinea arvoryzae]|uniref:Arabinose efflux permease n=1 Tax=Longilinea arvoryzae TaxID=360412 RepID=A0A0S7BKR0_9CHLR|nr:MFS transporter [Longilinea arvoryzae]GAP14250.1 arabinose efflux permease [Longilinea arvoryzae]
MPLFRDKNFLAAAIGHLLVDSLNGTRAIILTFLSIPLGLSNTMLGLYSTLYVFAGALAQPVFGFLADRVGLRRVVAGGILWMAVFYGLGVAIPGRAALLFLVLASMGSGAFHAAGAAQSTLAGRHSLAGHETLSASLFFVFGQTGYFIGPIIGGIILNRWEPVSLSSMALLALVAGVWASVYHYPAAPVEAKPVGARGAAPAFPWFFILLLALTGGFQSWAQQNVNTFLPKYLSDLGQAPAQYGVLSALFMAGSALGNLAGGGLADRYGRWKVIAVALSCGALPLFLMGQMERGVGLYIIILMAGMCSGAAYSAVVVLSQRLMPGGIALASGLALAFIFSSGSVGTLVSGNIADKVGLAPIFSLSAAISLAGGLFALGLREKKPAGHRVAEIEPTTAQD